MAAPWISSPSAAHIGDDLEILGGGVPASTEIIIKAEDAVGQLIDQRTVVTSSDGAFSQEFTLTVIGAVDFSISVDGKRYSTRSMLSDE